MTTAVNPAAPGRYTFNNATQAAAQQVRLLAEILDTHSTDVLAREGVAAGWTCLDLGAGGGTIATWLADEVSPSGLVVAMDKDPRHIRTHDLIDVVTADITTADLGQGLYDLVHARLLLMHLPNREEVLQWAARAVKPGGVLVISEWDCRRPDEMLLRATTEVATVFNAFQQTLLRLAVHNGASLDWAHRVPLAMHEAGLVDVTAELHNRLWRGNEPGCLLHACNSEQLESALLERGMTAAQLDVLRAGMADEHTLAWSYPMVTTVGRQPE